MYEYYSRLVVDSSKVGEDDADFAFLFSGVYDGTGGEPDLRTVANGGHVHNTDASGGASGAYTVPADLVFSLSPDGVTKLDFEVELYNAATGELIAWIQSGVSSVTDTVLYVVYGDKEVTTSQENVGGTWDANFKMVQHMQGAAYTSIDDSTSYGNDIDTEVGNPAYQQAGQVGYAVDFDGNDYIGIGAATFTDLQGTIEIWFKTSNQGAQALLSSADEATAAIYYIMFFVNDTLRVQQRDNDNVSRTYGGTSVDDGAWHYGVLTSSGAAWALYVDGSPESLTTDLGVNNGDWFGDTANRDNVTVGALHYNAVGALIVGLIDEVRVSNIARPASYVTTVHNNQSSPGTFYSVGGADRVRPCSGPSLPNVIVV